MKCEQVIPCEELRKMFREMDAPVYLKRSGRSSRIFFPRRPSRTKEEVEQFYASIKGYQGAIKELL